MRLNVMFCLCALVFLLIQANNYCHASEDNSEINDLLQELPDAVVQMGFDLMKTAYNLADKYLGEEEKKFLKISAVRLANLASEVFNAALNQLQLDENELKFETSSNQMSNDQMEQINSQKSEL